MHHTYGMTASHIRHDCITHTASQPHPACRYFTFSPSVRAVGAGIACDEIPGALVAYWKLLNRAPRLGSLGPIHHSIPPAPLHPTAGALKLVAFNANMAARTREAFKSDDVHVSSVSSMGETGEAALDQQVRATLGVIYPEGEASLNYPVFVMEAQDWVAPPEVAIYRPSLPLRGRSSLPLTPEVEFCLWTSIHSIDHCRETLL